MRRFTQWEMEMTKNELRKEFSAIALKLRQNGEFDAAARCEVLREWFTNEEFKDFLKNVTAEEFVGMSK